MTTTERTRTVTYVAPEGLPTVEIIREFDAPVERVFRAHSDPDLLKQWLGPRRLTMTVEKFDCRKGGEYRYTHLDADGTAYGFWGTFHDVAENRSITQTFGFDLEPDSAALERVTFTDLGDGRTRLHTISVVFDVETRDAMMRSGMQTGVDEGYEKLDELLVSEQG